jgi:dienelactone hydrolase
MRLRPRLVPTFVAFALCTSAPGLTEQQRREHLEWMLKALPEVPTWAEWQKKTGALPPDFDALPSANYLPDPLKFHSNGRVVRMPGDWPARRAEIRELFERHVVGRFPPKPKLERVVPVEENQGNGYSVRIVRLEFGPGGKASTQVTVTLPAGSGPFPVLIGGGWTNALLRRGYISVSYSGSVDQPSNLPELYPDFDFASMGQRAWTVQPVIDYLLTLPQVDRARIALTGYSREGKMAMFAAALDERIAAVVAGSTGVGGVLPWRLSGERGMGEGIESTTRMFPRWFAPQIRFFSGREDRLPVDANLLVALVAPRACLMEYGLNDEVSNVWGNEQTYHSAIKVYQALGKPDALGVMRVPGFHGANDQELCIDWLDVQFGRTTRQWTNDFLFPWNFAEWKKDNPAGDRFKAAPPRTSPATLADLDRQNATTRKAIASILGEPPPAGPPAAGRGGRGGPPGRGPSSTATKPVANPGQLLPDVAGWVIARSSQEFGWLDAEKKGVESRRIRFGTGITGDLYLPVGLPETTKLPAVVWLHGYSYPLGYMWVYRRDLHPILALVKAGYAVLAYDQAGFGARMAEIGPFYDRFPRWSQLGRMVDDVKAAIDALEKEANVEPQQIHLFGYTLGGTVALHAAALEPRVKSVVSISGFTPMRTDTADRPTGGLARVSVERPLAPRLGWFIGQEARVPYDYDELISAIAPRPVLVVQPSMDRDATPADVRTAVESARKAYALHQAAERLTLHEPHDYQRLPTATQNAAIQWMRQQTAAK